MLRSTRRGGAPALLAAVSLFAPACGSTDSPPGADHVASEAEPLRGAWQPVSGSGSAPALTTWSSNRIDMWVVGGDGALYQRSRTDGVSGGTGGGSGAGAGAPATWSAWAYFAPPAGTTFVGDPAAVSRGTSQVDLVVRGADGSFYSTQYTAGATTLSWVSLGTGGCASGVATNPALQSWSASRLDLWVRCPNGSINHRVQTSNNPWDTWANGGFLPSPVHTGTVVAGPAAVSRGSGSADVAVQTSDGTVWVNTYSTSTWTWTGWTNWGALGQARSLALTPAPLPGPPPPALPPLLVWATPHNLLGSTLTVGTGPSVWQPAGLRVSGWLPAGAVLRPSAITVDLVAESSGYQFTKWAPPPGTPAMQVVDANANWEPSAVAAPGGQANCPSGGRLISAYTVYDGSQAGDNAATVRTRDVSTGILGAATNIRTIGAGVDPTDLVGNDGQLVRAQDGSIILVRMRSRRLDKLTPPITLAGYPPECTFEVGFQVWKNDHCGDPAAWTEVAYLSPSALNVPWQPTDVPHTCPPGITPPSAARNFGGFDYPQAAIDNVTGRLIITTSTDGGAGTSRVGSGIALVSPGPIHIPNPNPFTVVTLDNQKNATVNLTVLNGTTYFVDGVGAGSVPRLRWMRANGTVGPMENGTLAANGVPFAWDAGQGHSTTTTDTVYAEPTWSGHEGGVSVTPWTSYVQGGITYDVLRVAYTTVSANNRGVVRVLKVTVPSNAAVATDANVANVLSIGDGLGGVAGSIAQPTWIGADLTQAGADSTMAMVYWQEADTAACGHGGGPACSWQTRATIMSDTDLSPPLNMGPSRACPGGCLQSGDYTRGGFIASGGTQSFLPTWIQTGTAGLNTAVVTTPKLN